MTFRLYMYSAQLPGYSFLPLPGWLLVIIIVMTISLYFLFIHSSSDERLPDIVWCREPFMEVLNEIED